jgi:predicted lipid-binding transport protein (Tim44 family)
VPHHLNSDVLVHHCQPYVSPRLSYTLSVRDVKGWGVRDPTQAAPRSVPPALFTGMLGGLPSDVSRFFGLGLFSITNLIFIFESLSTLDSTFTSAAKLFGPEFAGLLEDGTPKPPQRATARCARAAAARPACPACRVEDGKWLANAAGVKPDPEPTYARCPGPIIRAGT